jgi:chemotaxis protein methyltransferase CheR
LTLAIYARERLAGGRWFETAIDGFDLDDDRVAIAQRAECRPRSLRAMTDGEIDSYVTEIGPDRYRVKDRYAQQVTFFQGNLVDRATFTQRAPYDAIFCRNVLIYFTEAAIRLAIDNLVSALRPGGLLFLGHAESIIGMFDSLSTVRLGNIIAYQKR